MLHEVNTSGKQQEPNDHSLTAVRGCSHTISSRCRTPVHGCGYLQPVLPPNVRTLQGVIKLSMQAWMILTRCKSREVTSHTSPGHVHHGFHDESVAAKCQGTLVQSLSFSQSLTQHAYMMEWRDVSAFMSGSTNTLHDQYSSNQYHTTQHVISRQQTKLGHTHFLSAHGHVTVYITTAATAKQSLFRQNA